MAQGMPSGAEKDRTTHLRAVAATSQAYTDPIAGNDTLKKVWDLWHTADAPAAQAYLTKHNLPVPEAGNL